VVPDEEEYPGPLVGGCAKRLTYPNFKNYKAQSTGHFGNIHGPKRDKYFGV
jgi:hypothetical protein